MNVKDGGLTLCKKTVYAWCRRDDKGHWVTFSTDLRNVENGPGEDSMQPVKNGILSDKMIEGNRKTARIQKEQGTHGPQWTKMRRLCVYELRKSGVSFGKIAKLLSLSQSYVYQIYKSIEESKRDKESPEAPKTPDTSRAKDRIRKEDMREMTQEEWDKLRIEFHREHFDPKDQLSMISLHPDGSITVTEKEDN